MVLYTENTLHTYLFIINSKERGGRERRGRERRGRGKREGRGKGDVERERRRE
jgi:hypothetical protein